MYCLSQVKFLATCTAHARLEMPMIIDTYKSQMF